MRQNSMLTVYRPKIKSYFVKHSLAHIYCNSLSGHFMYVDSIYARAFKEVAKLASPMTTVPISGCLSFQYQRSEEGGNMFTVFARDSLGQYQELWKAGSESQSQVPEGWTPVQVDVKAPYSVQVST